MARKQPRHGGQRSGVARTASGKRGLLAEDLRRLQPKLRMIANGSEVVNVLRAELCAAVKVVSPKVLKDIPLCRGDSAHPLSKPEFVTLHRGGLPRRGHLKALPRSVLTRVFVETTTPSVLPEKVARKTARRGRVGIATVPVSDLPRLARNPHVSFIELAQPLTAPTPTVTAAIFDNLHMMHDIISDILAADTVPRAEKRRVIYAALAEFRDRTRNVMTFEDWMMMGHHMGGIEAMGGPVLGLLPGSNPPDPRGFRP